jgi:hypothetical protein
VKSPAPPQQCASNARVPSGSAAFAASAPGSFLDNRAVNAKSQCGHHATNLYVKPVVEMLRHSKTMNASHPESVLSVAALRSMPSV